MQEPRLCSKCGQTGPRLVIGRSARWCSICHVLWTAACLTAQNRSKLDHRFDAKVEKTASCWEWTGAKTDRGYGCIAVLGKTCYAHRIAYERAFGRLNEQFNVTHVCESRSCVNPRHLRAVPRTKWFAALKSRPRNPFPLPITSTRD